MAMSAKELGIDRLAVEDRLALIEEIWASIYADPSAFPLSETQRAELNSRVAEDDQFPTDVVPWDEVKRKVRARLNK